MIGGRIVFPVVQRRTTVENLLRFLFSTSMVESCCFVAGNFQASRFAPMFAGTWLESEIGSNSWGLPCLVPAMPG